MSNPAVGTVQEAQLEPLPFPTPGPSLKRRFKLPTIKSLSCFTFFSSNGLGKVFLSTPYSHDKGEYFASILAGVFCSISYHLLLAIPFRRQWRRSTTPRHDMFWTYIRWGMKGTDVLLLVLNLPLGGAAYNFRGMPDSSSNTLRNSEQCSAFVGKTDQLAPPVRVNNTGLVRREVVVRNQAFIKGDSSVTAYVILEYDVRQPNG
ncbi:hypothetical protein DL96DRAFT_1748547 [Flagelloscypha sp. PMI_526]|nr:hypothetical protein DL96DRAFT_1748547 [Flagelloscypha sp. PMI_526]